MIKKITLLILTTITSVLYAQTTIGESSLFATTTNSTWTHVFTAATTADGVAVSGLEQTVVINITDLPESAAYRIYKLTANGSGNTDQTGALVLGENTITVSAVNFNRAVKFQFSGEGLIEFDSFSHNGVVLYPVAECGPDDNIIGTSNLFVSQQGEWPYSLTLASIGDGNMGEVHSFTVDVTCLPAGGAQYRILKTGANGDITCCNGDLSLGLNTKNVAANGGWSRNVRFWFSSGDIGFSSITSNGSALGLQELNYALIKIHPNPATNFLTISGVNNIDSVKVYSVLGRLEKEVFNTHQIEVSDLASGIYFVKVSNGSNVISKKFIKQ